jgi:DNA-binding beta-propeller fold protein YncE
MKTTRVTLLLAWLATVANLSAQSLTGFGVVKMNGVTQTAYAAIPGALALAGVMLHRRWRMAVGCSRNSQGWMKTHRHKFLPGMLAVFLLFAGRAGAQIFVVYAGSQPNEGFIASYNLDGTLANASLISGLNFPVSAASSGGYIYEVNNSSITVGKYTTAGATVSSTLFTPINYPGAITVSEDGTTLFVATTNFNSLDGRIGKYTSSGATINSSLITGLGRVSTLAEGGGQLFLANNGPLSTYSTDGTLLSADLIPTVNTLALAVSGSRLFVLDSNTNTIGEYTTAGVAVNTFLVTGLQEYVTVMTVAGDKLYFLNQNHGFIGVYDLNTTALNTSFITGLGNGSVYGFAVAAVPEPSTYAALLGAAALAGMMIRRRTA